MFLLTRTDRDERKNGVHQEDWQIARFPFDFHIAVHICSGSQFSFAIHLPKICMGFWKIKTSLIHSSTIECRRLSSNISLLKVFLFHISCYFADDFSQSWFIDISIYGYINVSTQMPEAICWFFPHFFLIHFPIVCVCVCVYSCSLSCSTKILPRPEEPSECKSKCKTENQQGNSNAGRGVGA